MASKSVQLQIRVTPAQKAALRRLSRASGVDISAYVLARALPESRQQFADVVRSLQRDEADLAPLAALNDLLSGLSGSELSSAIAAAPPGFSQISVWLQNCVAAMVEQACHDRGRAPPPWVRDVAPLATPWFATDLRSLRLHLLGAAPVAFRRRNLFVDSTLGGRV